MINTNLNNLDILDVSQCPVLHPETFKRAAKYWGSTYNEPTNNMNKRPKIIIKKQTEEM
jgi:hypothetical protein